MTASRSGGMRRAFGAEAVLSRPGRRYAMLNEPIGWLSIVVGLVAGAWLGTGYDKPDWLGGYGSFRRRLVRLGHIALIALGFLNILFAQSVGRAALSDGQLAAASWLLIVGCISMPACCFLNAWQPRFKALFGVPVASLIGGCVIVAWGLFS